MTCCNTFETNTKTVEREPNAVFRPLNDCGDQGIYDAVAGTEYKKGMPVKLGETGKVEPATDGVDAIGLSLAEFSAEDGDKVQVWRTGHVYWSVIAPAIGADVSDKDAWWAIHKELAKANIYIEFK